MPDLTAIADGGMVHLHWNYIWGASSYRVYRSTSAYEHGRLLKTVKTTSYTDRPEGSGFVWYYQVEQETRAAMARLAFPRRPRPRGWSRCSDA